MPIKLEITDERMLLLLEYCVATQLKGISNQKEFCEVVGFQATNFPKVAKGERSFTVTQLHTAGKALGVNMNWLFGFDKQMFRETTTAISPVEMIKRALVALEAEQKSASVKAKSKKKY